MIYNKLLRYDEYFEINWNYIVNRLGNTAQIIKYPCQFLLIFLELSGSLVSYFLK